MKHQVFAALPAACLLSARALAEEVAAAPPQSLFSWGELGTLAGATAATLLIVQFAKLPLDPHPPARAGRRLSDPALRPDLHRRPVSRVAASDRAQFLPGRGRRHGRVRGRAAVVSMCLPII